MAQSGKLELDGLFRNDPNSGSNKIGNKVARVSPSNRHPTHELSDENSSENRQRFLECVDRFSELIELDNKTIKALSGKKQSMEDQLLENDNLTDSELIFGDGKIVKEIQSLSKEITACQERVNSNMERIKVAVKEYECSLKNTGTTNDSQEAKM